MDMIMDEIKISKWGYFGLFLCCVFFVCIGYSAGWNDPKHKVVEDIHEISVLKEKVECDKQNGTFDISKNVPEGDAPDGLNYGEYSIWYDQNSYWSISCSAPYTPQAPDLFNYKLK